MCEHNIQKSDLIKTIELNRPEPLTEDIDVFGFEKSGSTKEAIAALVDGYSVLITDFYSSGLLLLKALKKHLEGYHKGDSFVAQRQFRSEYRTLSNRILLHIVDHKINTKKAPQIGWVKIIYPEIDEFLLPYPQVQGLNSSWQWYEKGIHIPVLKRKLHPFYGTYFPTRFEHLVLFEEWLKNNQGNTKRAYDIGVGSGVLSRQLIQHRFNEIIGTDCNPNAIYGLNQEQERETLSTSLKLVFGDLFSDSNDLADLIVFNPPWIPLSKDVEGIDMAMYYDENLFSRFFSEAIKRMNDEGRLLILFSNLAQITGVTKTHPVEEELNSGGRFQKVDLFTSLVAEASHKTKRNMNWRGKEQVELWVLKKKS